jgi:mannose-6-phosphate isomerase-like protein (cupin superfamily)
MRAVTLGLVLVATFGLSYVSAQQGSAGPGSAPAVGQQAGRGARGAGPARGGRGGGARGLMVLSPKAVKPAGYTGIHRPHTKLADVLARHRGQADWTEVVVDDESLHGAWVSMGPGQKTKRRMNGDTREWWIVQSGQIRFTIEGQEPILASKGYMVQVPYRTLYQLETVGNEPSLRFEVNVVNARKLYPMDEAPDPVEGFEYIPTRVTGGQGSYDDGNRVYVNFNDVVAGTERGGAFVDDDRGFANIIMGRGVPPPPLTNRGHYHEEGSEFWLVMLGKIRYNIEGLDVFEADEGDIVYVPKQLFHLASFAGDGMACRLAMNGFPYQAHMFEAQ